MTYDELLAKIDRWLIPTKAAGFEGDHAVTILQALRAVIELHKPYENYRGDECFCNHCGDLGQYPCPTIQAIERELSGLG